MVTKSIIVRRVYLPSFASSTKSTGDSSGKSSLIGQSTHDSNGQREIGKQRSKSIAIVDDEEELCKLFSIMIKRLGYHAACVAHDGDEIAQAVLEDSIHPDLILMDYRMPTINGMQAAEKILSVRPEIKVIIATADDSVKQDAISAGLFFLQKPFSIAALANAINDALSD
jgi:DNA-binding NtrC family response regulator